MAALFAKDIPCKTVMVMTINGYHLLDGLLLS
jgi:hypothetical protein